MRSLTKAKMTETEERKIMNTLNCVTIIAILAGMTRCLKENIGKVQLATSDSELIRGAKIDLANFVAGVSKA